jgi:hypothetical protein
VGLDEVADVLRDRLALDIAPRLNAFGYLLRHILRPMFERVERDDANRSIELPGEQIGDDGLKVRPLARRSKGLKTGMERPKRISCPPTIAGR